jgi:hypothetical protein
MTSRKIVRNKNQIAAFVLTFMGLTVATLWVPFAVFVDLFHLKNKVGENSLTEWSQVGLLLVPVLVFLKLAKREADARAFHTLVSGFFAVCIIREMDMFFYKAIFHGSWLYFALAATAIVLMAAWRARSTVVQGATWFVQHPGSLLILLGLVVVMALSRTLGSGKLIWDRLSTDDTHRLFKTIVQESLELFGYILIAIGSVALGNRNRDAHCK